MRVLVSLSVALSIAFCWQPPAAAERVSQEPPREPVPVTPLPSNPPKLRYQAGEPIPPGYHMVERPLTGLIVTGAVTFGVTYGFTAGVAILANFLSHIVWDEDADDKWLALGIPVAGPLIFCASDGHVEPLLILDSAAQATGVALIVIGASTKSRTLVLDRPALGAVAPMPVAGGSGLMLSGTF